MPCNVTVFVVNLPRLKENQSLVDALSNDKFPTDSLEAAALLNALLEPCSVVECLPLVGEAEGTVGPGEKVRLNMRVYIVNSLVVNIE